MDRKSLLSFEVDQALGRLVPICDRIVRGQVGPGCGGPARSRLPRSGSFLIQPRQHHPLLLGCPGSPPHALQELPLPSVPGQSPLQAELGDGGRCWSPLLLWWRLVMGVWLADFADHLLPGQVGCLEQARDQQCCACPFPLEVRAQHAAKLHQPSAQFGRQVHAVTVLPSRFPRAPSADALLLVGEGGCEQRGSSIGCRT